MSWRAEVDELQERQRLAQQMGGAKRVRRQHEGGKLEGPTAFGYRPSA
jgi:hypothetical protein